MTTISINTNEPIVFVDTSYSIFHRYFATLNWYKLRYPDICKEHDNFPYINETEIYPDFLESVNKHYADDVKKWKKAWKVKSLSNIIFCKDCIQCNIWRNELYQEYKQSRVTAKTFYSNIFPILLDQLKSSNCTLLSLDRLEADDLVAIMVKEVRKQNEEVPIRILTSDMDYMQLLAYPNVEIHALSGKITDLSKKTKGTPEIDLMLKILQGDVSDNIPAVCAKLGKVTALKVASMSEPDRMAFLTSKGADCLAQFEKNKQLVSFDNIPSDLVEQFTNKYTISLV
jgi:5'-3' exonuclease